MKRRKTSFYRGVCFEVGKMKWKAEIYDSSGYAFLGYFSDEWAAANAYNEAAKRLHGKLARLNEKMEDGYGPD